MKKHQIQNIILYCAITLIISVGVYDLSQNPKNNSIATEVKGYTITDSLYRSHVRKAFAIGYNKGVDAANERSLETYHQKGDQIIWNCYPKNERRVYDSLQFEKSFR